MFNNRSPGNGAESKDSRDRRPRPPRGRNRRPAVNGSHPVEVIKLNESRNEFSVSNESYSSHTKALVIELKKLLSYRDPWSREVEFQRQNVRHQYMNLIFKSTHHFSRDETRIDHYPRKNYAIEALNLLWLDTTHALINVYRQKLSSIDKAIEEDRQALKATNRRKGPSSPHHPSSPSAVGPVARRKFLQKFRSFLSSEGDFWKHLINRLINQYRLENAKRCLTVLKISDNESNLRNYSEELVTNKASPSQTSPPSNQVAEGANSGEVRNEGESSTDVKKKNVVEGTFLVHKSLICFGDLNRYRELYAPSNQNPNNQPTSKFQSNSSRSPHQNFRQNKATNERDWSKTYECYNQARLLMPNNGNPSNQLAVLSSYIPDILSSSYHYFLALCVKNPFPTARQNLKMTFTKALGKWSPEDDFNSAKPLSSNGVDLRPRKKDASVFEADFVALHAMIYTQNFELFHRTNSKVCTELVGYLQDRALPQELILKMIVISMAEVWISRVNNQAEKRETQPLPKDRPRGGLKSTAIDTEVLATVHLLQFFASILTAARVELESIADSTPEADLSQNISAVLRRTLPALRIISKWVLSGHLDHIDRILKRTGSGSHSTSSNIKDLESSTDSFRLEYDRFIELAKNHFPIQSLPKLDETLILEEDLDLDGFLPIKKGMARSRASYRPNDQPATMKPRNFSPLLSKAVHPNEEHLMRLADNQRDSELIFSKQKHMSFNKEPQKLSKEAFSDSQENTNGPDNEGSGLPNIESVGTSPANGDKQDGSDDEKAYWIDDEDPVEMAMRAVVAQQMIHESHSGSDLEDLNRTLNRDDPEDVWDEENGGDEVFYLPHSCSLTPLGKQKSSGAKTSFSEEVQITPGPQVETSQCDQGLKTAADLLASMTNQISSLPHNRQSSTQSSSNDSFRTPVSPTGWSSVATITQAPLSQRSQTPFGTPGGLGRKTPSISLPRPAEGSSSFNIWSSAPRTLNPNPSTSLGNNTTGGFNGSDGQFQNELGGLKSNNFPTSSNGMDFKLTKDRNYIAPAPDWSISAILVGKNQERVNSTNPTGVGRFEENWHSSST